MDKGSSVQKPALVAARNGMLQVRYNIHPVTVGDGDDQRDEYQYNYIEVNPNPTRKQVIDILIRAKYDVNDEFALLALTNTDPEYVAYRDFITACKATADEVLGVL